MQDFCFLDLETTGFDPHKDSIIEISFVRYQDGELVSEVDQVCIPDKSPLTDFVSNLTGITQREIDAEGIVFTDIVSQVSDKIGDSVIVGHNIDFDINFLIANGVAVENNPRIDTHELARILLVGEESYALEVLTQKYGFTHESAHRAMSDVLASKDLFEFLLEKIEALPLAYLAQVKPILEQKTNWYAKELFLQAPGNSELILPDKTETPSPPSHDTLAPLPEPGKAQLLRIGSSQKSADYLSSIPGQHPGQKFVVVTPKLNFYPYFKQFPTPEVLFDPERFEAWVSAKQDLDNMETTFYLKCAYRNFLGHRGKQFFDIFTFKEPPLWDQVHVTDEDSEVFQTICEERDSIQTLVLTPYAFFRFSDLPIFRDRILIFDEGELCADSLFFAQTQTFSLQSYLDTPDEETATEAQFIVTDFCRNVIEEELQQNLSHFPTKLLLKSGQTYTRIADRIQSLSPDLEPLAHILKNPPDGLVRWVIYYPEAGNLVFHAWHPQSWADQKAQLQAFPQVWTYRHQNPERFFAVFVRDDFEMLEDSAQLIPSYELTIPDNLTSAQSPDFNASCAQRIFDTFQESCSEPGQHLAVCVSSVEALRQIHEMLGEKLRDQDAFVIGERASGGSGKVLELLKNNHKKRGIFLFQKLQDPVLETYNWQAIVVQKFPFNPPHPLFQDRSLESSLGLSWWDDRVIPQVAGNLSRAIAQFNTQKIILIDPRENAPWGKEIIQRVFE